MKKLFFLGLWMISLTGFSQALRDINYSYLYDPAQKLSFVLRPVRAGTSWQILYLLIARDTSFHIDRSTIRWEVRQGLDDKTGTPVTGDDAVRQRLGRDTLWGSITLTPPPEARVVVAQVIDPATQRAWFYFCRLDPDYPVNSFPVTADGAHGQSFISTSKPFTLAHGGDRWIVSYYDDNFPAAAPAFSEAQAKVGREMKADSTYAISGGDTITLGRNGLYLFQHDTLSTDGFALRAEDDYPRYTLFRNLPGPLIYICTKQEYDRLEQSADKKAFDRTVLSITGDTDRARKLIRSYFRRVELANLYFSSYKEGWKTDRGMIYIIFGLPDRVYRFNDREVWKYDNSSANITFDFIRSPSVFDPENYVLLRNRKYQDTWYMMIDLWRNARF